MLKQDINDLTFVEFEKQYQKRINGRSFIFKLTNKMIDEISERENDIKWKVESDIWVWKFKIRILNGKP